MSDNANDSSRQNATSEQRRPSRAASPSPAVHAEEDEPQDQRLLAVVLSHAPAFATAKHKRDVWDVIARDPQSRGHFRDSEHARLYCRGLLDLLTKHGANYPRFTPTLLEMLTRFKAFHVMRRRPRSELQASSSESLELPTQTPRQAGGSGSSPSPGIEESPKAKNPTAFDAAQEEQNMAIVLKHAPAFATAKRKSDVWDAIANDSSGRWSDGESARLHCMWLLKVLNKSNHVKHNQFTPRLREMLATFQQLNVSRKTSTSSSTQAAQPTADTDALDSRTVPRKRRRRDASDEADTGVISSDPSQHRSRSQNKNKDQVEDDAEHSTQIQIQHKTQNTSDAPHETGPALAQIQLPDDEVLLRAVVAHLPQLTDDACAKLPVWDAIARDCGRRFLQGRNAAGRVTWLMGVWRQPRHRVHGDLTPALQSLLQQFASAVGRDDTPRGAPKRRACIVLMDPSKRRRRTEHTRLLQQQQQQVNRQAEEETHTASSHAAEEDDGDGDDEEELEDLPPLPRASGRVQLDVEIETLLVRLALEYAPALAHANRTSVVWDAIARGSRGRYASGISARHHYVWLLKVLHDRTHNEHAKLTPALRKMLGDFERLAFQGDSSGEINHKKTASTATVVVGNQAPVAAVSTRNKNVVRASEDELLMQLILDQRPFDAEPYAARPKVWKRIIEIYRSKAASPPRILNSSGASGRLRWLLGVFEKPTHSEHATLTPKLRRQLAAYTAIMAARQQPEPSIQARPVDSDKEAEENDEELVEDGGEEMEMEEAGGEELTAYEDEVLLREILRVRPIHPQVRGQGYELWDQVAKSVSRQLGTNSTVFPTGSACIARMKKVLREVRHPKNTKSTTAVVSSRRLEMAALVDTLLAHKSKWPSMERDRSETYCSLMAQVDSILASPLSSTTRDVVREEEEEEEKEGEDDEHEEEEEEQGPAEMPVAQIPTRSHCIDNTHSSVPAPLERLQGENKTHEDSLSVFTNQIRYLQDEVATCRSQVTLAATAMETERRDHRRELRAMVDHLVNARESHARTTAALRGVLEAGTRHRSDVFQAMIKLATRVQEP